MKHLNLICALAAVSMLIGAVPVHAEEIQAEALYRMYNPNSGEHFYTENAGERDSLVNNGWRYEGVGWSAPETAPNDSHGIIYRLYNPNAGDHFYTTDNSERKHLISVGWKDEGSCCYSDAESKHVPIYRQYNPNAKTGAHNYTASASERDALIRAGWKDEGIAWYAVSGSKSDPSYTPPKAKTNQGTAGNLYIPALCVNVALYDSCEQSVVDAENSAACFKIGNMPVIADHAYQAFENLSKAAGTTAVITQGSTVSVYVCRKVVKGINTGHCLTTDNGNAASEPYDLLMYTCQDTDGINIWIAYWDSVQS